MKYIAYFTQILVSISWIAQFKFQSINQSTCISWWNLSQLKYIKLQVLFTVHTYLSWPFSVGCYYRKQLQNHRSDINFNNLLWWRSVSLLLLLLFVSSCSRCLSSFVHLTDLIAYTVSLQSLNTWLSAVSDASKTLTQAHSKYVRVLGACQLIGAYFPVKFFIYLSHLCIIVFSCGNTSAST